MTGRALRPAEGNSAGYFLLRRLEDLPSARLPRGRQGRCAFKLEGYMI